MAESKSAALPLGYAPIMPGAGIYMPEKPPGATMPPARVHAAGPYLSGRDQSMCASQPGVAWTTAGERPCHSLSLPLHPGVGKSTINPSGQRRHPASAARRCPCSPFRGPFGAGCIFRASPTVCRRPIQSSALASQVEKSRSEAPGSGPVDKGMRRTSGQGAGGAAAAVASKRRHAANDRRFAATSGNRRTWAVGRTTRLSAASFVIGVDGVS
jgi:hypothetical protein